MKNSSKRTRAYIYLLINVVSWGLAFPIVKWGLPFTTPFRYLLYRFFFASVLAIPLIMWYLRSNQKLLKHVPRILVIEVIGTLIALSLAYTGLNLTSALQAGLITTSGPIFITMAGIFFLREKEERNEWTGLSIATLASFALVLVPVLNQSGDRGGSLGGLFLFIHNICIALYYILARRYYIGVPKLFTTCMSIVIGLTGFFILSFIESGVNSTTLFANILVDLRFPQVWIISLYMAIVGTFIGLTAYMKGQELIESSEASIFAYLQPFVYIPLSVVLLKEGFTPVQGVLLVVIMFGVSIAQRRTRVPKQQGPGLTRRAITSRNRKKTHFS